MAGDQETVADGGNLAARSRLLYRWVVPYIGNRPIAAIEAPELLDALKRIEAKNLPETAHRTREICGRVFRYAIATGRARRDLTADLRGALAPRATKNFAAITEPAKVGELLRAIDGYDGQPATSAALKLPTSSSYSSPTPSGTKSGRPTTEPRDWPNDE